MEIIVLGQAKRELKKAPQKIIRDLFVLLEELEKGKKLSMPTSRPLYGIARGLHELRLFHDDGTYRVFYVVKVGKAIYVLHGMGKKTQKMDMKTKNIILNRIRSI